MWLLDLLICYDPAMSLQHLGFQGWRLWHLTNELTKDWLLLVRNRKRERERDRIGPPSASRIPGSWLPLKLTATSAFISKMYGVNETQSPFVHLRLVIFFSVIFIDFFFWNAAGAASLRSIMRHGVSNSDVFQIIWLLCSISSLVIYSIFLCFFLQLTLSVTGLTAEYVTVSLSVSCLL